MRVIVRCLAALSLLSGSSASSAQTVRPDIGQWVAGPVGSAKDLGGHDAVSSGQLAMGNAVVTNTATILLGCKGGGPRPAVELRAIVPHLHGFAPGSIN